MTTSTMLGSNSLAKAMAKSDRQLEGATITGERNSVAQSIEDCGAMSAGRQVPFDVDSELFTYVVVEVVREFSDDVKAIDLHILS